MDKNKKIAIAVVVAMILIAIIVFFIMKNTKEVFTVSYMINGQIVSTEQVEEDSIAKKPSNPTKDGYEFLGWYLGNEKYDFSSPIANDITLEAKWKQLAEKEGKTKYTITIDIDGEKITIETDENGIAKQPEDPTKEGCTFLGWYIGEEKVDFSMPFTNDITIEAKWEENQKEETTVGTTGTKKPSQSSTTNKPAKPTTPEQPSKPEEPTTPEQPSKPEEPTTPEQPSKPEEPTTPEQPSKPGEPTTPEQPSKPEEPTVTEYTVTMKIDDKIISTQTVGEGKTIASLPATPTKTGHTFKGWYSNGNKITTDTVVNSNMTVEGQWDTYTFSVNLINDDKYSPNRKVTAYKNGTAVGITTIYGNYNGKAEYTLGKWNNKLGSVKIVSYEQFISASDYKIQLGDGTKVLAYET